jgi:hypothetical protein
MIGSNYSIIQLLTFSVIGLVLFVVCLLIGLLLYKVELNNNIKTYFFNSFLGFFTIVCLYSYSIVGLKTINLLSGIVLAYLCFKNNSRFKFDKLNYKELFPILYIFPIVFILFGCSSYPSNIECDVQYYSKVAYSLKEFKQENLYHFYNQYNSTFHGIMPYHYCEMWITSLLALLFKVKSIIATKYITYPFFISCTAFGVLGFIKKNRILYFILFILLSTLPVYMVSIFNNGFTVYTDFWLRPNFIIYYYSLLALIFIVVEENWVIMYLLTIIVGTTSFIIIPSLYGSVFLLSLFLAYKKVVDKRMFIILNSTLFAAGVFMITLFYVFSPKSNLLASNSFVEIIVKSLSMWKAVLYTITTLILESFFIVFICFLLNKYVIKNNGLKNIFLLVAFQLTIGIILFQLVNQLDNSYQFPYLAFSAAGFIFIITMLLIPESIKNKGLKYSFLCFIFGICLYMSQSFFNFNNLLNSLENQNLTQNGISNNWVKQVDKYLSENENARGGFVLCEKDLQNVQPKARQCLVVQTGSFISYITDNCNLPNLTCKDTLLCDKNAGNQEDYKKVESWIDIFPKYTNQCNVNEFIKKGEIDYFVCTKNKVNIDTSLVSIITDAESKYIFVMKK